MLPKRKSLYKAALTHANLSRCRSFRCLGLSTQACPIYIQPNLEKVHDHKLETFPHAEDKVEGDNTQYAANARFSCGLYIAANSHVNHQRNELTDDVQCG